MAIKLTLPSIGSGSSKDSVVSILAAEWPISAQEIYNRLKKAFGGEISYRAVHKTLKSLVDEKVVEKVGKDYRLNKDWISNLKRFSDSLVVEYENGSPKIDYGHFKPLHIVFDNFFDTGVYLISEFYANLPNPERKACVCFWNHAYPSVGVPRRELEVMKNLFSSVSHYGIARCSTPLDKYYSRGLSSLGKKSVVGCDFSPPTDTFIQGDYIMQIILPVAIKKKMERFYSRIKDAADLNLKDYLDDVLSAKANINAMIFKNPELADKFRQEAIDIYNDPKSERVE